MCIMLCTQHALSQWINSEYILIFGGIDQDAQQGDWAVLPVSSLNHHNTPWDRNSLSSVSDDKEAQKVCEPLNSLGQLNSKAHIWPLIRSSDSTSSTKFNATVGPKYDKLYRNLYLMLITRLSRKLIWMF